MMHNTVSKFIKSNHLKKQLKYKLPLQNQISLVTYALLDMAADHLVPILSTMRE